MANVIKPIKEAILSLKGSKTTLTNCYFSLACLGCSINNIFENKYKMFHWYAIAIFNDRFREFDFDKYLLAYYIHPGYKGKEMFNRKITLFIYIF